MTVYLVFANVIVFGLVLAYCYFVIKKQRESCIRQEAEIIQSRRDLQSEKESLEFVLLSIDDGLIITNTDNVIKMVNFSALRMFALKSDEMVGRLLANFLPIEENFNRLTNNLSLTIKNRMGKSLDLKVDVTPLIKEGRILGSIYTLNNVTEQNKFEKLKIDFIAQVAHQLRTPLSITKNYLYMFSKRAWGKLSDKERIWIERAYSGSDRLEGLIDNLLNISRIERGQLVPQLKDVSLEGIIISAKERIMNYAVQKKIKVEYEHPAEAIPDIKADPLLIGEALNNLLENAIDFSNSGGSVLIALQKKEGQVVISIQDFGIGIPTEALPHIFSKFYKVTNDLQQTSQGIGLGLYNAKAIVEAHKGKIWVNSLLGRGSTFSFSLPIS